MMQSSHGRSYGPSQPRTSIRSIRSPGCITPFHESTSVWQHRTSPHLLRIRRGRAVLGITPSGWEHQIEAPSSSLYVNIGAAIAGTWNPLHGDIVFQVGVYSRY
ncbi:hypothetical protein CC2G_011127 [Coprinopsis cinerea AmutBmut pab1-1]|nr:hypothetical protein CC2G_011127 [Coprinopsis cinerea AmutBmut pab1-1]